MCIEKAFMYYIVRNTTYPDGWRYQILDSVGNYENIPVWHLFVLH